LTSEPLLFFNNYDLFPIHGLTTYIFHQIVENGQVALEAGRLQDVVAVLGHDERVGTGLEQDLGRFDSVLLEFLIVLAKKYSLNRNIDS
jgi:hypothetical protein